MILKGVLILCTVSVFCGCDALSLIPRDRISGYPTLYYPHRYEEVETPTEMQEEKYGKESERKENEWKFYVFEQQLSWYDARDACKAKGMALTSLNTYSKHDELRNYLREHSLVPKDQYSGYWIGSHRLSGNEPWIWESDGLEIRQYGWLPGEPNGYEGEDCMEFKNDFYSLGWNNYYCSGLRGYICENLPHSLYTVESDKNIVQDSKDVLHEETFKNKEYEEEYVTEVEDTQSLSTDETTTTELPEEPVNFQPVPEEFVDQPLYDPSLQNLVDYYSRRPPQVDEYLALQTIHVEEPITEVAELPGFVDVEGIYPPNDNIIENIRPSMSSLTFENPAELNEYEYDVLPDDDYYSDLDNTNNRMNDDTNDNPFLNK